MTPSLPDAAHPCAPAPKVAIVHEWLVNHAGSEKVVEQMLLLYPDADLFTVVDFLAPEERAFVGGRHARTTFIQKLPFARKRFRGYLPLMPLAIEQHDLSAYDLVLSSSHAVAKGVITGPDQLHVSYVHSPMRYAWELQHQYLRESGTRGLKGWLARMVLHYLRQWDLRTANGVDVFIANSSFIARRVRKVYRREAQVIYPPVDVARFTMRTDKEGFYLAASRMVPYKKMPLLAQAFAAMPDKRLIIIGDGPELDKVRAVNAPNVTVLGFQPNEVLIDHMQRARAFVFAAEEDFGITPVEAQACGTPVIAYGRGGSLESVRGSGDAALRTGLFFHEQTAPAIVAAVLAFEAAPEGMSAQACRRHAERFAPEAFRAALKAHVDAAWAGFCATRQGEAERVHEAPPSSCAIPRAAGPLLHLAAQQAKEQRHRESHIAEHANDVVGEHERGGVESGGRARLDRECRRNDALAEGAGLDDNEGAGADQRAECQVREVVQAHVEPGQANDEHRMNEGEPAQRP